MVGNNLRKRVGGGQVIGVAGISGANELVPRGSVASGTLVAAPAASVCVLKRTPLVKNCTVPVAAAGLRPAIKLKLSL